MNLISNEYLQNSSFIGRKFGQLFEPAWQVDEGLRIGHVEDQQDGVGAAVIIFCQTSKPLLKKLSSNFVYWFELAVISIPI